MKYREFLSSLYCPVCSSNLYIEEVVFNNNKSCCNYYCDNCNYKNIKFSSALLSMFSK